MRLLRNIEHYLKIFEDIQKVALSDRLPARLAAYTFWSLLLLLLMLLGAVALAVAVAFAFAVAVAVTDTFRMGGDHESYIPPFLLENIIPGEAVFAPLSFIFWPS